jgi:hypothetical protein
MKLRGLAGRLHLHSILHLSQGSHDIHWIGLAGGLLDLRVLKAS